MSTMTSREPQGSMYERLLAKSAQQHLRALSVRRTAFWSVLLLPLWWIQFDVLVLSLLGLGLDIYMGTVPAWLVYAPCLGLHVWLVWCYQVWRTKREMRRFGWRI